jgi:hypothetical protein
LAGSQEVNLLKSREEIYLEFLMIKLRLIAAGAGT